jgi:hypothetical protein
MQDSTDLLTTVGVAVSTFFTGGGLTKLITSYFKASKEAPKQEQSPVMAPVVHDRTHRELEEERRVNDEKDRKILELSVERTRLEERLKVERDKLRECMEQRK